MTTAVDPYAPGERLAFAVAYRAQRHRGRRNPEQWERFVWHCRKRGAGNMVFALSWRRTGDELRIGANVVGKFIKRAVEVGVLAVVTPPQRAATPGRYRLGASSWDSEILKEST